MVLLRFFFFQSTKFFHKLPFDSLRMIFVQFENYLYIFLKIQFQVKFILLFQVKLVTLFIHFRCMGV